MTRVKCDNCGWKGEDRGFNTIRDLSERLDPTGTVPSCECPKCGALCYEMAKPVTVYVIWGESPEPLQGPVRYDFGTFAEANAFRLGIESSMGWFGATEVNSARARAKKDRTIDARWVKEVWSS